MVRVTNLATHEKCALCITYQDLLRVLHIHYRQCAISHQGDMGHDGGNIHLASLTGISLGEFNRLDRTLLNRSECESDDTHVQLIPYVIVFNERGDVLCYTRGSGGNEARLHGKVSIGIGGHLEEITDEPLIELIRRGALRELEEELGVTADDMSEESLSENKIRIIYQRVPGGVELYHLGLIYFVEVKQLHLDSMEPDTVSNLVWMKPTELMTEARADRVNLEGWSGIIAHALWGDRVLEQA